MKDIQKESMSVMRVQDESGSHIEPVCDQAWPELKKLRWQAAVISMDTGLRVMVHEFPTNYCINVGSASIGIRGYTDTSKYLSGISIGAEQYAKQIAPSMAAQAKAEALAEVADKHEREITDLVDERDSMHEWADRLAYATAPMEVIGEHSNSNNPWENALDYLPDAKKIKAEALREAADVYGPAQISGFFIGQDGYTKEWLRARAATIEGKDS